MVQASALVCQRLIVLLSFLPLTNGLIERLAANCAARLLARSPSLAATTSPQR